MIKYTTYSGTKTGMIRKIHWDKIHMASKTQDVIQFIDVSDIRYISNDAWNSSTRLNAEMSGYEYSPKWEIVVPTSASAILDDCPKDFIGGKKVKGQLIAGKLGMKEVFKDKDLRLHTMKDSWGDFDREFDLDNYTTELH
tara:strand:- start:145 stop:564 length:420 start_codon:yes stop_codon:yes gene_type:complete